MSISPSFAIPALLGAAATQQTMVVVAPASQPTGVVAGVLAGLVLLAALVGICLVFAFGVFRPQSVIGPNRLPARGKAAIVLASFGIGLFFWFGVQAWYGGHLVDELRRQGVDHPERNLAEHLTPRSAAFLSTVPPSIAFVVMLAILLVAGGSLVSRLGLNPRKLPLGLGAGALAFVAIYPLVVLSATPLETFYQRVHFTHPTEHELLNELGHAQDPRLVVVIALGAMLCAPMFEELLFRGHLQTLLRHAFAKIASRGSPKPVVAVDEVVDPAKVNELAQAWMASPPPPPPGVAPEALGYFPAPALAAVPELPKQTSAWPSWLAILITSLLFAAVHPPWMAPLIFVLSLGLGYIYERTGTLWASITVHFLFNLVNTAQYYFLMRGGH